MCDTANSLNGKLKLKIKKNQVVWVKWNGSQKGKFLRNITSGQLIIKYVTLTKNLRFMNLLVVNLTEFLFLFLFFYNRKRQEMRSGVI